jgi:hypothetical protein
MRTERAFDKFRSPRNAKEYFADKPGSKYEGMAKENLEEQIKAIRNPSFKVMAKGGRVGFKNGSKGCKLATKGKGMLTERIRNA